jgi:hypothetical protein
VYMGDFTVIPPGGRVALSADRTAEPPVDNFAFVMNVSSLVEAASFIVAPNHELRQANAYEISVIEDTMLRMATQTQRMLNPWKHRTGADGQWETIPEKQWRYFVIGFQGTNQTLEELAAVFSLAPLELKVGFTIVHIPNMGRAASGVISNSSRLFQLLEDAGWGRLELVEVTASDVAEFTMIYTQLRQHNHPLVDVNRYTRGLQDLQSLPGSSPLLFLGYFALLESLLVHQPDPKDPLDSITRQVKNKIALLNNRFQRPLDYGGFEGANPETVWTRMYDYRSRLAHGDTPDFSGSLAVLGNREKALDLVKATVKATVRQALVEPQLVADIRNC